MPESSLQALDTLHLTKNYNNQSRLNSPKLCIVVLRQLEMLLAHSGPGSEQLTCRRQVSLYRPSTGR